MEGTNGRSGYTSRNATNSDDDDHYAGEMPLWGKALMVIGMSLLMWELWSITVALTQIVMNYFDA